MLDEVPLSVNIEAAHERLCTPYTLILYLPLFSELLKFKRTYCSLLLEVEAAILS